MKKTKLMTIAAFVAMSFATFSAKSAHDMPTATLIPAPREMRVTGGEYWATKPPTMEKVAGIPPEGYELSIRPDGMTIRYSDDAGAFYAKMTLFHMERWNSYTTARVVVPGSAPKEYVSGDYTVVVAPRR